MFFTVHFTTDRNTLNHFKVKYLLQWNLDLTNLYLTRSSIWQTIFFTSRIVKYMKKKLHITNLVTANKFCQSFASGPSLNRGSTVCWTDPLAYLWRYSYELHTVLLGVAKACRTSVRFLILNNRHVTPAREPWIDHVQPWFYHGWTRFPTMVYLGFAVI